MNESSVRISIAMVKCDFRQGGTSKLLAIDECGSMSNDLDKQRLTTLLLGEM
jgi:hypothetical protein